MRSTFLSSEPLTLIESDLSDSDRIQVKMFCKFFIDTCPT